MVRPSHIRRCLAARDESRDGGRLLRRAERRAFRRRSKRRLLPADTEKGCLPKWHRLKLDRDIARRHGLHVDDLVEDVTELI